MGMEPLTVKSVCELALGPAKQAGQLAACLVMILHSSLIKT